jgi:hypothetical protein
MPMDAVSATYNVREKRNSSRYCMIVVEDGDEDNEMRSEEERESKEEIE